MSIISLTERLASPTDAIRRITCGVLVGYLWGTCGGTCGVVGRLPGHVPNVSEHHPYEFPVGMKFRIGNTYTAAFIHHKGNAAPPILQNIAFIQHIGDNRIAWLRAVLPQQFRKRQVSRERARIFNFHPIIVYGDTHRTAGMGVCTMAKSIDTALAQCFVRDTQLLLLYSPSTFADNERCLKQNAIAASSNS